MPQVFDDPVTVSGTPFNQHTQPEPGVYSYIDVLDGWEDTAEPTVTTSPFGFSDGVVAADRFPKKEQYIGISGVITAPDRATADRYKEILSDLFDRDDVQQVVRFGSAAKAMDLKRSGYWRVVKDLGQAFRWSVTMMAPWPYKYSPVSQSLSAGVFPGSDLYRVYNNSGSFGRVYVNAVPYGRVYIDPGSGSTFPTIIQAYNAGTADAYPHLSIVGPLGARAWQVVNDTTDEALSFALDLGAGQSLEVETRTKTARMGIQPVEYYIRGDYIRLVKGANTIRLQTGEDNPDARVTVTFQDTWKR